MHTYLRYIKQKKKIFVPANFINGKTDFDGNFTRLALRKTCETRLALPCGITRGCCRNAGLS